jgi:hypothetical protein
VRAFCWQGSQEEQHGNRFVGRRAGFLYDKKKNDDDRMAEAVVPQGAR